MAEVVGCHLEFKALGRSGAFGEGHDAVTGQGQCGNKEDRPNEREADNLASVRASFRQESRANFKTTHPALLINTSKSRPESKYRFANALTDSKSAKSSPSNEMRSAASLGKLDFIRARYVWDFS